MAMNPVWLNIEEKGVASALREAVAELANIKGEAVLDFSSVCRIDPSALQAMEEFVGAADNKGVKIILRGVNINIYKVLKLVNLSLRFSFES